MDLLVLILYIAALVCFGLGAFGVPARVGWTPLGLAFWLLGAVFLPMAS